MEVVDHCTILMEFLIEYAKESLIPAAVTELQETGMIEPFCMFGFSNRLVAIPLAFKDDKDKDKIVFMIRSMAKILRPLAVIFVSDSLTWTVNKESLSSIEDWYSLSDKEKCKIAAKCESILIIIDSRFGKWMGSQFYERSEDDIIILKDFNENTDSNVTDFNVTGKFMDLCDVGPVKGCC